MLSHRDEIWPDHELETWTEARIAERHEFVTAVDPCPRSVVLRERVVEAAHDINKQHSARVLAAIEREEER